MLEHGTVAPHLRGAAQLAVAHPQVGALLAGEAHRARGTVVAGDRGVDPEAAEPGDERAGEPPVDGVDRAGGAGRAAA